MDKSKNKNRLKYFLVLFFSIAFLIILFFVSLYVGRYKLKWNNFWNGLFKKQDYLIETNVLFRLRLPRTLMAMIVGASLSIAGFIFQEIFRNNLVSPNVLGVTNGASIGAIIGILIGLPISIISLMSFSFGIVVVILTIFISKIFTKYSSTLNFVLAGIIVSSLTSSIIGITKYIANENTTLPTITFWLLGSLQNITMKMVLITFIVNTICIIIVFITKKHLVMVSLGKVNAETKGLKYIPFILLFITISTTLTATSISASGSISWVGLIIPHIVKIFIEKLYNGKKYYHIFMLLIVWGALFVLLSDIISRTFTSSEIPISAITGLLGSITFVLTITIERFKKYGRNNQSK